MRIGTWNVANRLLTNQHQELIESQACDVWLLTEIHPKWTADNGQSILNFHSHLSRGVMGRKQYWAAVLSLTPLVPLNDPHPASAAVQINGITYSSTILPWRGVKPNQWPWQGTSHSEMTGNALEELLRNLPKKDVVWGGDWNHSLQGKEHAGSIGGRRHIQETLRQLALQAPTANLLHRGDYCNSIDHIAIPKSWEIKSAIRIDAQGLSDHDAFVIEV